MAYVVLPPARPLSSHEIQACGRMPTKSERQAFSYWRNANPNAFLSQEDADRVAKENAQKAEQGRYMPASWNALEALCENMGKERAELIKALIEAMIQEALHPENEE